MMVLVSSFLVASRSLTLHISVPRTQSQTREPYDRMRACQRSEDPCRLQQDRRRYITAI